MLRFLTIVVLFPLAFYGAKLTILPVDFYRLLYPIFLGVFVFYILHSRTFYIDYVAAPEIKLIFWLFVISLLFASIVSLYTGNFDFTYLRMHLDYILTCSVVLPLICRFYATSRLSKYDVPFIITAMGTVQALIMIAMLLSFEFQSFVFQFIDIGDANNRLESIYRFRAIGLTGFASYSMAVCQSFIAYMFIPLWMGLRKPYIFALSLLAFIIVVISALLSARTAFIFLIPLYLWITVAAISTFGSKFSNRLLVALLVSVSVISIAIFAISAFGDETFELMISWILEFFSNYSDSGQLSTASTESTKELFFLPSETTILFGDGLYLVNGLYYMQTDIGYLRILLYGGIVGSFLFYAPFVLLFYFGFFYTKKIYGLQFSFLITVFLVLMFIVNIKGSIFFDGFSALKFITLYILLLGVYCRKQSKNSRMGL